MLAIIGAAVAAVTQILVGMLSDRRRLNGAAALSFTVQVRLPGLLRCCGSIRRRYSRSLAAAVVALQIAMNVAIGPYQAIIPDFCGEEE